MSLETLLFLRELLGKLSLNVSDPEFRTNATHIVQALDELDDAISERQLIGPDDGPGPQEGPQGPWPQEGLDGPQLARAHP
jgi:hypothetical protein